MKGTIIKSTGSWYAVRANSGTKYSCRLRGVFKLDEIKATNPVAVGDQVIFEVDDKHQGEGLITQIEPRENYMIRRSPHNTKIGHLIAANLDQVYLIASLKLPRTSLGFIDRFLVTAETFRIPAGIIFNKTDLLKPDELEKQKNLTSIYSGIGYSCFETSVTENYGISEEHLSLQGKVTLFSGISGVGKSSLLNILDVDINQKVEDISSVKKGKHTTTFAQMFELSANSFVIDTPGIKELGLLEVGDEELSHYFPELRHLFGKCKFYNCTHTHEPGCAVEEAIGNGHLALSRYDSYLSILEDKDNRR